MLDRFKAKAKIAAIKGLDAFFHPLEEMPVAKWLGIIFIGGLFIVGLLNWGFLLNWFSHTFDMGDWHMIAGPELLFLQKAIRTGQLPLHGGGSFLVPDLVPDRYLTRVGRPFSPQFLLLYFFDPNVFILINIWIMYAVGFVGLVMIRKRYHLSLASFTLLFLLFSFNGHITAHYAVGHLEWAGYYLLPFYAYLVLVMVDGNKAGWSWVLGMALTMLFLNLQGAYHLFLYCMVFLLLLALFRPRFLRPAIKAVFASGLASMIRLLPTAVGYFKGGGITFGFGFLSISQMFDSFIVLHLPFLIKYPGGQAGAWEFDYFLGLFGLAFVAYFGMVKTWLEGQEYRCLYLPMVIMAIFSLGNLYEPLFNSHIPFTDSERAPTRFIIIPLVILIVLAVIRFQSLIAKWGTERWMEKVIALGGIVFIAFDLFQHTRYWRPEYLTPQILEKFNDVLQVTVVNRSDLPYTNSIIAGIALTIVTTAALIFMAIRERKADLSKSFRLE